MAQIVKEALNGTCREFFLISPSPCALGEQGPYCEGPGGLPNLGVIGVFPFCHPSDPVLATGKFRSSLFSYTWILITFYHSGLGDNGSLPLPPSTLQPHVFPRSDGGKGQVLITYKAPPKLACPPLRPYYLPSPALASPGCPGTLTSLLFWDTPSRLPPQGFA